MEVLKPVIKVGFVLLVTALELPDFLLSSQARDDEESPLTSTPHHMFYHHALLQRFSSACAARSPPAAKSHGHLIKTNLTDNISSWNIILTSYGRWSDIRDAQKLFDEMPEKDSISWNALISACVTHEKSDLAWEIFLERTRKGIFVDQYTCGSLLKSIAASKESLRGRLLHSLILKVGLLHGNVFSGSALLDMYFKCKLPHEASSIFSCMGIKNSVSWNSMISGFVLSGDSKTALEMFKNMEREEVAPDEATFATLLSLDLPKSSISQLHCKFFKSGWSRDTVICNAAITAYSLCRSPEESQRIFFEMEGMRDLVSWNSMLAAYAYEGFSLDALKLFVEMINLGFEQDDYTFTTAISAMEEEKESQTQGRSIHGLALKRGLSDKISVSNALISFYAKSNLPGSISDAMKIFDVMEKRDIVSWNSILTGLSQRGLGEEATTFFVRMIRDCCEINHYAFSAALRSCSDLAALGLGRQIHALVEKSGSSLNPFTASSLITMYSRSGAMDFARRIFDESSKDCSVTWNSILFAYAQHGHASVALDLLSCMLEREIDPDHITFVAILSACSHAGMVQRGREIMESMVSCMNLRMEHYACMVDLYSRAGHLDEAMKIVETMPFEPDGMVLKPLLGACRIHGDLELAERVAGELVQLEPEEHSTYVMLSNVCAAKGRWGEIAKIKRIMREGGVMKVPGYSWIEVKNMVWSFNAEDTSHPEAGEIFQMLGEVMRVISMVNHDGDDTGVMVDDSMGIPHQPRGTNPD